MSWKVYYYQTGSGRFPVKEFIEQQDEDTVTKINKSIRLLIDNGPFLKPPYIKKLQDKLYELRIFGEITIRVFYSPKNNAYYLLHAFKKKSDKTHPKDLKVAIDRMKEIV